MFTSFVALATFLGSVAAHGHIVSIKAGGAEYQGYNPQQGTTEDSISRPVRNMDNGFVQGFTASDDMVCGVANGGETAPLTATVEAGSSIEITWDTWPESHVGPVTDYLADCGGDCSTFEATTSTEWFPIQKYAMSASGEWLINSASGINAGTGFTHQLKVPAGVPNGNYVLRHEIVALHGAPSDVQAYVSCYQIEVTGGAASAPAGLETCTFPACYEGAEVFQNNIYNPKPTSFPIPGPEVAFGSSGGSTPAAPKPSAKPSSSVAAPKPSSSSVVAPAPSTSSVPEYPAEEPTTPEVPIEDAPIEEEEPIEEAPVEVTSSAAAPAPSSSKPATPAPSQPVAPAPSKPETPSTPGSFADYNSCMKAMNECKNKVNQQQGGGERDFSSCEAIGSQCNSLRKRHMKKSLRPAH